MKRIALFLMLHFLVMHAAFSQEMFGIINSNYSGNLGLTLNPASVVAMPFRNEFNIHSEALSIQNNLMYFNKGTGIGSILSGKAAADESNIVFYNSPGAKEMYGSGFILGPAYARSSRNSGWALHTAIRINSNIDQLNNPLAKFLWDGLNFEKEPNLELSSSPYSFNMLQWYEIGFTYGHKLLEVKRSMVTLGGTANFNIGSNAIYIKSESMNFNILPPDQLEINNFTGVYAHTFETDNSSLNDFTGIKGTGGSFNLGMQYYFLHKQKQGDDKPLSNNRDYLFRFGASLIDVGYINFFNNNQVYEFKNDKAVFTEMDTIKFNGINDFEEYLNTKFTGSPEGAATDKTLSMGLPAAASVQLDVNIYRNLFANITCIKPVDFYYPQVKRPGSFSISARYQSKNFEIALPYSVYQQYKQKLGFALRYKFFFIGTDEIGSYLGSKNIDGMDAYFGFKFTTGYSAKSHKNAENKVAN